MSKANSKIPQKQPGACPVHPLRLTRQETPTRNNGNSNKLYSKEDRHALGKNILEFWFVKEFKKCIILFSSS